MGTDNAFADSALLIIDVINDFAFPGGEQLLQQMPPVVEAIEELRRQADAAQRPVIYINDNFGRWRSNFQQVIEYCRREGSPAVHVVQRLAPRKSDYFVLKPGQSAFYQTPLPALLDYLKISKLILAGVAGDQCVLNTAMDAHMRDLGLWVPADATASITPQRNHRALDHLEEVLGARVVPVGGR